jgi:hypothetical protein
MALLSRKTCGLAIQLLEKSLTRTKINTLFYKHEVPLEIIVGDSKEQLLLNVFQSLELSQRGDIILGLIQGALGALPESSQKELKKALIQDGFVATDTEIVPDETRAEEHKNALEQLIAKHTSKLTSATLFHHLKEAEEQFRLEKWDASIGQARNFVEQLLLDVAVAISNAKNQTNDLEKPLKVRNYLQSCGFFDESERKKLVDGIYGYFSEEGSHPGISEQSTARICLSILWTFGFYVLEKFDEWPT